MFQQSVNLQPAPAVQGDFASSNPRASVLTPTGGMYVAGAAGVTVGQFAWANPTTGLVLSSGGVGSIGFVHREQQALITTFLAESGVLIQPGFPVNLSNQGDFWDKFAAGATRGQKVFASYADGSAIAGTAGSPPTGAVVTGAIGGTAATSVIGTVGTASVGATCTGSIATTVLTVASAVTGVFHVGQVLSGTNVTPGTTIVSLGTGTGGVGTYNVSVSQTATSTTITAASTIMDVTAIANGALAVGQVLTEAGLALGTTIVNQLTGSAGGVGTYTISGAAQTTASAGFTAPSTFLTAGTVTGKLHVGDVLSGSGVTACTIVSQQTGTAGATGNYTVSVAQAVASTTITATSTVLDVSAVTSGALSVGDPISGSGVTSGTTIAALGTGTGGTGSYTVSVGQQAASTTITALGAVETPFYVATSCGAGELAKISTWGA